MLSRRQALRLGLLGSAALSLRLGDMSVGMPGHAMGIDSAWRAFSDLGGASPAIMPFAFPLGVPRVLPRTDVPPNVIEGENSPHPSPFRVRQAREQGTDYYVIRMVNKRIPIPGLVYPPGSPGTTAVWAYTADGHPPESLLGPTIKSQAITSFLQGISPGRNDPPINAKGQPFGRPTIIKFINQLEPDAANRPIFTTVHLHGGHQGPDDDGHPDDLILPLRSVVAPPQVNFRLFEFQNEPNSGQGAQLWYHDHTEDFTGRNVYMGLAGFYVLEDELDARYQLEGKLPTGLAGDSTRAPTAWHDIPLVIQDRRFDANGQLNYDAVFDQSGVFGDTILVNGVVQPFFQVDRGQYRFRILNGSNVRVYLLTLSNPQARNTRLTFTQIGTDGGLLPKPVVRDSIELAPAERVEVVVDFSGVASMQSVILENHGDEQADGGRTAQIMRFDVVDRPAPPRITIPDPLRTVRDYFNPSGTGRDFLDLRVGLSSRPKPVTRAFEFDRGGGEFSINGQHFAGPCQLHGEPERFDAIVVEGTDEIWEVSNSSGGWYHPVHIHDNEWQVLDRNGQPPAPWEVGWKETFFLRQDTVRVLAHFETERDPKFPEFRGTYVFHCHVMEHEDHMMMSQFSVVEHQGDRPPPTPTDNCPPSTGTGG